MCSVLVWAHGRKNEVDSSVANRGVMSYTGALCLGAFYLGGVMTGSQISIFSSRYILIK